MNFPATSASSLSLSVAPAASATEFWCVDAPFRLYLAWICIATLANLSVVIVYGGDAAEPRALLGGGADQGDEGVVAVEGASPQALGDALGDAEVDHVDGAGGDHLRHPGAGGAG